MSSAIERLTGKELLAACTVSMWQNSSICSIKKHILYVCQHPQNHRQGSVGETHCSCLSLSGGKYSSSFHHFGSSLCMCMIIHQIHFPGAQQKTAREEGLTGTHRWQCQLAHCKHVKGRGLGQWGQASWLQIWYQKYFCVHFFKSVASEWSCWLELPFLITEQMQLRYGNALLIIMTWSHLEVREEQKGFPPGDADCSVVSIKRAWHFILFRCRLFVTGIFLPAIRCRIICSGASYGPWKCGCQWLAAPVGKARLAPWEYGKIKRAR